MDAAVRAACALPASETISQIVEAMIEIIATAKDVVIDKDSFMQVSGYFQRIVPVLRELSKSSSNCPESLNNAVYILNSTVKVTKDLIADCRNRNKMYLLMNCRTMAKRLEAATREISRALSLISLTSVDLSSGIVEEIGKLNCIMQGAEFRVAVAEEEILDKIHWGIQERNIDRSSANELITQIAEALGISTESSVLKREFEEFKSEIENVRMKKEKAEAIQMDQIIALLERADVTSSPIEKEKKYFSKRKSLGTQPLDPLKSFICPITIEVMVDPVETSSGQTFERTAIKRWFADGNTTCPMTMTPLDTSVLRPNRTLRHSIQEWKDRNTMIMIARIKPSLQSETEEEILHGLRELRDLCEERDIHREWVILEGYIPILIKLHGAKNPDIRSDALIVLCILVKDSNTAKESIFEVDNAIESIVHSLGRRPGERKLAVSLLLELSKSPLAQESFGKIQGCILLLVTLSRSDDSQAARDAKEILENLSVSDQNVIEMAKANYFKHLLLRLSSGPEDVRVIMAKALAEMELTDYNKSSLFENGALGSLLHLVSHVDIHTKHVAVEALYNLSSLPSNGQRMIREGSVRPLLDLLYHYSSSSTKLREQVAAILLQLALSTSSQETSKTPVSLLESNEDINKLFNMINITEPGLKTSILRIFHALCHSPSAANIKAELFQCSTVRHLILLFEPVTAVGSNVRANAVKLLHCLVEDGDKPLILECIDGKCIERLINIIRSSDDEEEVASAMGIISNLPEDSHIASWLCELDALNVIFSFLRDGKQCSPHKNQLIENAVGIICHLTVPTNWESQKLAAKLGIIPILVQFLELGTALTKRRAAISLTQFSKNSLRFSRSMPRQRTFFCFSPSPDLSCPVHRGFCTVESSFCLVEADAVTSLAKVLGDSDASAGEACLDALLTLIEGERLQSGSKVLADANAIPLIIKSLSSPSQGLAEKALEALERIFRLSEYKQMYGNSAHVLLVDITQRGNRDMKSLAAKILGHLNVLHQQSSFF